MDNHHNYNPVEDGSALDGFTNAGYDSQQHDNYFHDPSLNNGFDPSWSYPPPSSSAPPAMPDYAAWQSQGYPPSALQNKPANAFASPVSHAAVPSQIHNFSDAQDAQRHHTFDPSLGTQASHDANPYYGGPVSYVPSALPLPGRISQTVAPSAVESIPQVPVGLQQRTFSAPSFVDQLALLNAIPKGKEAGIFYIVDEPSLSKTTASKRMAPFLNVSQESYEYPITKGVIPAPSNRKSRKQLRKLAADDPKLLAKLGKAGRKPTTVSRAARIAKAVSSAASSTAGKGANDNVSLSDSSSEYDSSDYDSDESDLPNPLPAKRPDDDLKAGVRYDTLKALWRARRSHLPLAEIRTGLKDFWEVVRTIRDRWKTDTAAVKAAEEKGKAGELPLLKSRVRDQREMIETAFTSALEHGHKEILEVSSENASFLFLCYQFLQDRFVQGDLDGVLSRSILGILSMCVTLNEEKMTKTHLVKVLPRYSKKGGAEVQAIVAKINASAKEAQATDEQLKSDAEKKTAEAAVNPPPASKAVPAGVKRPAPTSSSSSGPAKRVAGTSAAPAAASAQSASTAVKRALPATTSSKIASTTSTGTKTPMANAAPTKTKTTTAKPSAFFNAMQGATKKATPAAKPAVSSVVAAAIKSVEKPPAASSVADKASKAGFSFADTMANLSKPKEKAPAPKERVEKPAETAQEKAKRLRKEARRGLRVTFKPDNSLVEIRLFTHDPDEEYGHDSNMTRDAGDVSGEGRMFKQHKDQMDLDDEDDGPGEEELRPYKSPSLVDFGEIQAEDRDRSFAPFGGGLLQPESPEKTAREQYESNTLMVFYADPSDIPPTPKEPTEESESSDSAATKAFGMPEEGSFAQRLANAKRPMQTNPPVQTAQTQLAPPLDFKAILAALTPQAQPPSAPQSYPFAPAPAAPAGDLQSILAQFAPSQATQQQQQQQPAAVPNNVANLIASLQSLQKQPPQPQVPAAAPDLSAILKSFQQNQAAPPPLNPSTFPSGFQLPPGFPQLGAQFGQQQASTPQSGAPYENEERRRLREGGEQGDPMEQQNQFGAQRGLDSKHFTQPCKYWPIGRCQKGDKCTYRHE